MEKIKKIKISDDPWSESFKEKIRLTPHYKTALQWKQDIDIDLSETFYYNWLLESFKRIGKVWDGQIKTEKDILVQCKKFRDLFKIAPNWDESSEIQVVESKSQDNVWFVNQGKVLYFFGPITVRIDEFGDFVVSDGNHRLALLLVNDLPIEVVICERHEKWKEVISSVDKLYPIVMYQPFRHPEFSDRKCSRSGITEEIVKSVVDKYQIKTVLDLGCCHGETLYALRNMINLGVGVESNEDRLKLISLLFSKLKFEFSSDDIHDFLKNDDRKFDMILVLAVFHHFMYFNSKEKFIELLELITSKTKFLMYELPEPNEPQYAWMYKDFDAHSFIQSYFKHVEFFKKDRRKIYLLRK